jgi:hypothetical protein
VPLVHGELVERSQEAEAGFLDSMAERAALPTDSAVTRPEVIEVGVDLEANPSAVA